MFKSRTYHYPCPDNNITCHPIHLRLGPGSWKIELWGAGASNGGGYTAGILFLPSTQNFYAYLGGQEMPKGEYAGMGGYNGGGNSSVIGILNSQYRGSGGSGASDIRLVEDDYQSRIMVAGGAGGGLPCMHPLPGGYGGGLTGGDGTFNERFPEYSDFIVGRGGTQTSGGSGQNQGDIGVGAKSEPTRATDCAGAGGGGYFGGGSGYHWEVSGSGGGGSSYISGYQGCEDHQSHLIFKQPILIPGNQSVPNPHGNDMIHYIGQGVMRITRFSYYCSRVQIYNLSFRLFVLMVIIKS